MVDLHDLTTGVAPCEAAGMTFPLAGTGIWNGSLRYGDPAKRPSRRRTGGARLHARCGFPTSVATCSPPSPTCSGRRRRNHRHRDPQPLDAHARGDGGPARGADRRARPRFLVGVGVSHGPLIDIVKEAGTYRSPRQMREYLDGLDAATPPLADGAIGCWPRSGRRCWSGPDAAGRGPPVPRHPGAHRDGPRRPRPGPLVAPEQARRA